MLVKEVEDLLNSQVDKEGYSSHLYLAMASWAETEGYKGIAEWLYAQAEEERMHMLKLVRYINERDGKAKIDAVKEPPAVFGSIKEMFDQVLKHEQFISASINDIVKVCIKVNDHNTHNMLQWYVKEQIEEESSARDIIDKLKLAGNQLYLFDRDIMSLRSPAGSAGASAT